MLKLIKSGKIVAKLKKLSYKTKIWFLASLIIIPSIFFIINNNVKASTELKYASSHITGAFTNPTNAVGTSDSTWAGDLNTSTSYTSRWAMEDPSRAITGTQTISVFAKKGSNSGNPTIAINLYESSSLVTSVVGDTSVTSTTGQTVSGTFNASIISNPNNVEIEVVQTAAGGGPSARNSAQIEYIEWTVNLLDVISISQDAFRFYEDGTESGSTATDTQGTNISRDLTSGNSSLHLRLRLQESGAVAGATTDDWQLQYSKNSGTYESINNWGQQGNSLNVTNVGTPSLAALSSTTVAYFDSTNEDLRKYSFNGTTWSLVGNELTISASGAPALATLSSSSVAYYDTTNEDLRTYSFDGTDWSQVGNDLTTITGAGTPALAALNSTTVAYFDSTLESLRTYSFDGTDWSQVGNGFTISGADTPALAALNSTTVGFIDSGLDKLSKYSFDGTNWTLVGNELTISGANNLALTALSSTDVAFFDSGNVSLRRYTFDGTNWSQVDNGLTISSAFVSALAALNSTSIAYIDSGLFSLRTYNTAGDEAIVFNSSNLTDGAATTNRASSGITDGTGSFVASKVSEDGLLDNFQITASNFTEALYSMTLVSANLSNGDTLDFRVLRNGAVVNTYSATPRITIVKSANSAPSAPTLITPSSGTTGVSTTPQFTLRTSDTDSDYLQYRIYLYQSNCSTAVGTSPFAQASSQTGWSGQDANTNTAYIGSSTLASSTIATYTYQSSLSAGTTYCWKADAIDPGGSNTYSSASSTQLFTTAVPNTGIQGGTVIQGGSVIQ
jgi:hypothetical protein